MTKIKLCGLRLAEDIEYANMLMPEYIGFVFAPSSRRYISPEDASALRRGLSDSITPVGVFVDADIGYVLNAVKIGAADIIQLHGSEDEDYISALRAVSDRAIIKAFSVKSENDINAAQNSSADYVLLDSGAGGSGIQFNHSLINNIKRDFFLAGGLDSRNVQTALKQYSPYAVDTSSALETNGIKDLDKMRAFVDAVRKGKELYI